VPSEGTRQCHPKVPAETEYLRWAVVWTNWKRAEGVMGRLESPGEGTRAGHRSDRKRPCLVGPLGPGFGFQEVADPTDVARRQSIVPVARVPHPHAAPFVALRAATRLGVEVAAQPLDCTPKTGQ